MKQQHQHTYKDCLTNELLMKRFSSQFDLVRYALEIAKTRIQKGQENPQHAHDEVDNMAFNVLEEIAEGQDSFSQKGENDNVLEVEEALIAVAEKKGKKSRE